MALDTYANLQTEIIDWLARSDLASKAPTFVSLFEADIQPKASALEQVTRGLVTTTVGTATVLLPAGTKQLLAIAHAAQGLPPLDQVSPQALLADENSKVAGVPIKFSLEGSRDVRLAPIPDGAYGLAVVCRSKFAPLADDNTSNWVLEDFPNLYLYGSLSHAKVYLQDAQSMEIDAKLPPMLADFDLEIKRRKLVQATPSFHQRYL